MNLSGNPVKKLRNYFKIENTLDIILIHDDIDMEFLKLRVKVNGGHGGHNGVRDAIKFNGENFYRVKLGISNKQLKEKKVKPEKIRGEALISFFSFTNLNTYPPVDCNFPFVTLFMFGLCKFNLFAASTCDSYFSQLFSEASFFLPYKISISSFSLFSSFSSCSVP